MRQAIKNLKERTPDMHIRLGKSDVIMLYWRNLRYTHQVTVIVFKDHKYVGDYTTSGENYNKEYAALDEAFQRLKAMPEKWQKRQNIIGYRVGGNYYKVPVRGVRVWRC